MGEEDILLNIPNKELLHQLKYCRVKARDHIAQLKELAATFDRIKAELRCRIEDLEIEAKLAEFDRINSEDPFFSALLDLH